MNQSAYLIIAIVCLVFISAVIASNIVALGVSGILKLRSRFLKVKITGVKRRA